MKSKYASDPVTGPQKGFLKSLVESREVTPEQVRRFATLTTKGEASTLIGELKQAPYKGGTKKAETKPGYYVRDGEVFQVVISKTGNPYAKKMVVTGHGETAKGRWEYAPGVARELETLKVLTATEAGALGKAIGACMICGKTLTKQESIDAGIGPICAGKLG